MNASFIIWPPHLSRYKLVSVLFSISSYGHTHKAPLKWPFCNLYLSCVYLRVLSLPSQVCYPSWHFQTCVKLLLRLARALVLTKRNIFVWLQPTLVSRTTLGTPSNENADLFDVSFPTGSLMFSFLRNIASCLR